MTKNKGQALSLKELEPLIRKCLRSGTSPEQIISAVRAAAGKAGADLQDSQIRSLVDATLSHQTAGLEGFEPGREVATEADSPATLPKFPDEPTRDVSDSAVWPIWASLGGVAGALLVAILMNLGGAEKPQKKVTFALTAVPAQNLPIAVRDSAPVRAQAKPAAKKRHHAHKTSLRAGARLARAPGEPEYRPFW